MPQLKLKRLYARNWGQIHEMDIEFPDKGLVLVTGANHEATAGKFASIGSGKTLIGEALSRALVDVSGRFSNLGHYSTDQKGNKDTLVKVSAAIDDKPLLVELGYKCAELSRTGEGLRFTYNNQEPIQRANLKDTREELQRALKINPELAEWTVFVDGDKLRFNRLSEKKSVELLMSALNQPPWTQYQEHANKVMATFKRQADQADANHQLAQRQLAENSKDVEVAKAQVDAEAKRFSKLKASQAEQVAEIQKVIKDYEKVLDDLVLAQKSTKKEIAKTENEGADAYAKLDAERNQLRDKLAKANQLRESESEEKSKARFELGGAKQKLELMQSIPDKCPECLRPWNKRKPENEIEHQHCLVQKASNTFEKIKTRWAAAAETCNELSQRIEEIEDKLRRQNVKTKVQALSEKYEATEAKIQRNQDLIHLQEKKLIEIQKEPDRSQLNRAEATLEERLRQNNSLKERLAETAQVLAEAEEAVKIIQYWTEAFGPTGIPNMVLRDTIGPLNEISRRLSNLLTGGTINISYDTRRELASGKERAELVTVIENRLGCKRLEGSSKGESGLTNLIIAETLAEIGQVNSRIGYKFLDEVVQNQDTVVRRSIFAYLKEQAARLGILIFIVDHSQEAAGYADHILLAEKTAGGTKVRWVS